MENKDTQRESFMKLNLLKKIWYSISKFEKYPEMAALGVKKAIIYFTELMLIFSAIYTCSYVYYVSNIAEFETQDLSFSEKVITLLIDESQVQDSDIIEMTGTLGESSKYTIISALFISFFINFFLITLVDVFVLSLFGLITCHIARIKMNYKALFNMSVYALTLSIILRLIYMLLTTLTDFEVKYFDIMYMAVSYISLAAAIFLIKSDIIKQHLELMRIIEEGKDKIEKTITIPKRKKEEDEDNERPKDEDKKEDKKDNENGTEGESSNA